MARNLNKTRWLVRFRTAEKRGETPTVKQVTVTADSERGAVKAAFLHTFGGLSRPIHNLEILGISRVSGGAS